jgi:uncharacterized protein with FMN-binding domain
MPDEQVTKKHLHISQFILLIVAGLGWSIAALEFTPPNANTPTTPLGGGLSNSGSKPTPTPSAVPTTPVTNPTTPAVPSTPTPTPTKTSINGTFIGADSPNQFGSVQVQVTITNNKITDVTALKYPNSGRSQQISQNSIPLLVQQTLTAQSSNIDGVSGASYTSQSFYDSLVSALAKAGL